MSQHTESSKLLTSRTSSRAPTSAQAIDAARPAPAAGGMFGAVQNIYLLVHGLGEQARGTILGGIDDWEARGEQKHHEVARKGKQEMAEAYQALWGTGYAPTESQHEPAPTTRTSGYNAAPPTYSSTGRSNTDLNPDSKSGF